jgi:hypothetical protein
MIGRDSSRLTIAASPLPAKLQTNVQRKNSATITTIHENTANSSATKTTHVHVGWVAMTSSVATIPNNGLVYTERNANCNSLVFHK